MSIDKFLFNGVKLIRLKTACPVDTSASQYTNGPSTNAKMYSKLVSEYISMKRTSLDMH